MRLLPRSHSLDFVKIMKYCPNKNIKKVSVIAQIVKLERKQRSRRVSKVLTSPRRIEPSHKDNMMVNTGKMNVEQIKSFANQLCSIKFRDGIIRPTGDYPEHWNDEWHEEDGGDDAGGIRPQVGVTLKAEMDGLSYKGGYETAWDDVSNAELVPQLVKEARDLEMAYFKKLGVYLYGSPAACKRSRQLDH